MDGYIAEIKLNQEIADYIERLWFEYISRKDIITSLFELHKNDSDPTVLDSVPFKHYENLFADSKIAYETAMEEVRTYVPEEYSTVEYRFEVVFGERVMRVYHV